MKSFCCRMSHAWLVVLPLIFVMCSKSEEKKDAGSENAVTTAAKAAEQEASNRGTASATFGEQTVSINYGRPQLQGRDVLAMATEGMVWRMGMNEATEIKTSANLKFGDTVIPAGQYSLWMKKISGEKWDLVFNKQTGIWGHDHPAAGDFASAPMTFATVSDTVEVFTIEVKAQDAATGSITATWGTAALTASFSVSSGEKM